MTTARRTVPENELRQQTQPTKKDGAQDHRTGNYDLIKRFSWEISSINVYLDEIRQFWAKSIGVSGPQWMILMAILDLDQDDGVPVNVVSKLLHVDPSFVTTQSKLLEKKGLLRRKPSPTDARVVQMSLTDKTRKHLASLSQRLDATSEFVFEVFGKNELVEFTEKLVALKNRLEKARMRMAIDF